MGGVGPPNVQDGVCTRVYSLEGEPALAIGCGVGYGRTRSSCAETMARRLRGARIRGGSRPVCPRASTWFFLRYFAHDEGDTDAMRVARALPLEPRDDPRASSRHPARSEGRRGHGPPGGPVLAGRDDREKA